MVKLALVMRARSEFRGKRSLDAGNNRHIRRVLRTSCGLPAVPNIRPLDRDLFSPV